MYSYSFFISEYYIRKSCTLIKSICKSFSSFVHVNIVIVIIIIVIVVVIIIVIIINVVVNVQNEVEDNQHEVEETEEGKVTFFSTQLLCSA